MISHLYLENRIMKQSKSIKVCKTRYNKTSEAKFCEAKFGNKEEKQTKNQSSVTLDAKDLLVGAGHWLSEQERRVDALALRAEERRDKLRKAAGSCT